MSSPPSRGRAGPLSLDVDPMDLERSMAQLGLQGSPLSLLSPNSLRLRQPPRGGRKGADELPEEEDVLGALPSFRGGGSRAGVRRADPRRQSLALASMFARATAGEGLLDDSEIAVGDEDIQIPLAKSSKLLGGNANHSTLWVDPDVDAVFATDLPEPKLSGPMPPVPESPVFDPQHCASPSIAHPMRGSSRPWSGSGQRPAGAHVGRHPAAE